eukprot:CAMPEP_0184483674 /NCGR_PEP_ID=MMETSP0113_2-20130426/5353_1 /TAXON_ID=91329 /ORGANISM="Norrisiella sphaerica, Strain BC52" /LENGTH=332 /DNA_ID=CAMNT_0026864227 /DNA_START=116 /DNA_END=1111 /DNA_ORIENTATION=-
MAASAAAFVYYLYLQRGPKEKRRRQLAILRCRLRNFWARKRRWISGVDAMLGKDKTKRLMHMAVKINSTPKDRELGQRDSSWDRIEKKIISNRESSTTSLYPSAWAKSRRFTRHLDSRIPKITFYRDSAIWCPFCEMVWLYLEELQIPYDVEKPTGLYAYGDMDETYARRAPELIVPAIQIDEGPVVTNAYRILLDILEKDDRIPGSLMPSPDTRLRFEAMEMLHAHVDALDLFMKFTGLTSAGSGSFTSKIRWYLQCIRFVPGHLDLKEGYLRQCMEGITDLLERHKGPYFLGDIFSIVDVVYAPLIERMVALSRRLVPDGKYNIYENVEW